MGRFIRHARATPVEVVAKQQWPFSSTSLDNVVGGLSCQSPQHFTPGTTVEVHIPQLGQQARYQGVIAWCRKQHEHYRLGVAFFDADTLFRARMAEQICEIEEYRKAHSMSFEQAADCWIAQHAERFPGNQQR